MKNGIRPDPNKVHPINGYDKEIYIKPTITNPNIIVGNPAKVLRKRFDDRKPYRNEVNLQHSEKC